MQEDELILPFTIYSKYLETISNIKFSFREVDILSSVLNGKSVKGIAHFLSISPYTVETHIRNIFRKLECNSRDGIIQFIESSDKFLILKKYYSSLLLYIAFEQSLKHISQLTKTNSSCLISYRNHFSLLPHFCNHLKQVGLIISLKQRKESFKLLTPAETVSHQDYVLYCLSEKEYPLLPQKQIIPESTFLLQFEKENIDTLLEKPLILIEEQHYYFSFLELIQKIFFHINFNDVIENLKKKHKNIQGDFNMSPYSQSSIQEEKKLSFPRLLTYLNRLPSVIFVIFIVAIGVMGSILLFNPFIKNEIRSDLNIPNNSILLSRPELIAEIDKAFKESNGIQIVALVGIGGSGKTTLAREYARQQNAKIIWEIHAETKESILRSLTNLAYTLVQTPKEAQQLNRVEKIKPSTIKYDQFIKFIKSKMKNSSDWFLIYDNVEDMLSIQAYFPHSVESWGRGRILITTRDHNIESNKLIKNTVQIPEMSSEDKFTLFSKIMDKGNTIPLTSLTKKQRETLLQTIPSFPLDVSIAAYYLKSTGTNYRAYLDYLQDYRRDFVALQSHIIKNTSDYTQTRYGIICVSLNHIIKTNEKFKDFLLFISLLDAQHIPKFLLNSYAQNPILVDNFIFHLKKYSLITSENRSFTSKAHTLCIHPSTQQIILSHLDHRLDLKKNNDLLLVPIVQTMASVINEAMEQEDLQQMRLLINHCKKLTSHRRFFSAQIRESLNSHFGKLYYYFGDFLKAKGFFEENLTLLNQDKDALKIADTLLYLGIISRKLGHYKVAKELLEASLKTFEQHLPPKDMKIAEAKVSLGAVHRILGDYNKAKNLLHAGYLIYQQNARANPSRIAWTLARLGNVYRNLGDYKKAQAFIEKSLKIYQDSFPDDQVRRARVLSFLAIVHRERGNYRKAKNLLEESLSIYHQNGLDHHTDVAWSLCILATVYKALGDYSKSINLFEQGIKIYKVFYSENIEDLSWALSHLGVAYKERGYHSKAKELTEKSLKLHQNFFGDHNIRTSWALVNAATVYKGLGQYEKAKVILEKSLVPYEKHYGKEHVILARILRELGEIYLLLGNIESAESLLKQSLHIFSKNAHPEKYTSLEILAFLCMQKYFLKRKDANENTDVGKYKTQAIANLKQALDTLNKHFPNDSPHIIRIKSLIKFYEAD